MKHRIEFIPPSDSLSVALHQERQRIIGRVIEAMFVDLSGQHSALLKDGISITKTTFEDGEISSQTVKLLEFYKSAEDDQ